MDPPGQSDQLDFARTPPPEWLAEMDAETAAVVELEAAGEGQHPEHALRHGHRERHRRRVVPTRWTGGDQPVGAGERAGD
jgi:hypothetical protein